MSDWGVGSAIQVSENGTGFVWYLTDLQREVVEWEGNLVVFSVGGNVSVEAGVLILGTVTVPLKRRDRTGASSISGAIGWRKVNVSSELIPKIRITSGRLVDRLELRRSGLESASK